MPDLVTSLSSAATPVGLGIGLLQEGIGIVGAIKNKKEQRNLLSQRKAYQTPQEIFDILNLTQNNASQGYDATTLNYLTSQTDNAFSSSIDAAELLGGNPNDLSSIFNQKINSIMKIGADNHVLNMQNFSQYLGALGTVAENKAAEAKSQQDILKDKLQATGLNLQSATGNISGGLNTILGTLAAEKTANLYNPDGTLKIPKGTAVGIGSQTNAYGTVRPGTII